MIVLPKVILMATVIAGPLSYTLAWGVTVLS